MECLRGRCLKSISSILPTNVENIDGMAFVSASVEEIGTEAGSCRWRVRGGFLTDFDRTVAVRYVGHAKSIEAQLTFDRLEFPIGLKFESESRVMRIEEECFSDCASLNAISNRRRVEISGV